MDLKDYIVKKKLSNVGEDGRVDGKLSTEDFVHISDSAKETEHVYPTDYAVASGIMLSPKSHGKDERKRAWAWLRDGTTNVSNYSSGLNMGLIADTVDRRDGCIQPVLSLDVQKVMGAMARGEKVISIIGKDKFVDEKYVGLSFGSMPQTFVGKEMSESFDDLARDKTIKPNGKEYFGGLDGEGKPIYNKEYDYMDKKCVRVSMKNHDYDSEFADGTMIRSGDGVWFEVEPIIWKIKNWKEMPKAINPKGNGKAETIDLVAREGIVGGIPFYPNTLDADRTSWKNSSIRGYLNGLVNADSGDFRKCNFLNEAFEPEIQKQNTKPKQGVASTVQKMTEENKELDMALNKNNKVSEEIMEHVQRKPRKGYGITIEEKPMSIDDQLKFYINAGESFMLHGPSGVGKTKRIEEIDPDFVAIVLRNGILPEEVIGKNIYPNIETTNGGKWVPPSWYVDLCEKCKEEPKKNHVLFIDEITNVKPYEQSLVYHLVLNNSIGPNYGKLPNNAVVVAAGNSMEESASAYNMPEPLFRRFSGHVYLPLDIPSWLEWGSKMVKDGKEEHQKIHPLVSNFVATFGEKVFHTDYDAEEPPKYAIDPRGWEQISDIIYKSNGRISKELIENKLGDDIAKPFMAFASKPPLLAEDIVDGNYSEDDIPEQFDEMYALVLSLRYVSKEDLSVVRTFVEEKLGGEMLVQFDKVWVNGDAERAIYLNIIKKQAPKEQSKSKKEKTATEEDKTIEPSESLNGKNGYSDLLVDITPKGLANLYSICRKVLKDAMDGEVELEYVPKALYTHIEENKWPVLIVMMEEQGVFESVENTLKFINVVIDAAKGKVKSEDQGMRR